LPIVYTDFRHLRNLEQVIRNPFCQKNKSLKNFLKEVGRIFGKPEKDCYNFIKNFLGGKISEENFFSNIFSELKRFLYKIIFYPQGIRFG